MARRTTTVKTHHKMKLRPKTDTIAKRLEWWICAILITITLILTFRLASREATPPLDEAIQQLLRSTERIRQLTK